MEQNYITANTVVRKITYANENELHTAINTNLINHGLIFKLVSVMPIDEHNAYIVLVPDTSKITAKFIDIGEDGIAEVFADAPNGDYVIISISELDLLRQQQTIYIGDDTFEMHSIQFVFNSQAERYAEIRIRKIEE